MYKKNIVIDDERYGLRNVSISKIKCDVFCCEKDIRQISNARYMLDFRNCKINTLIISSSNIVLVHILHCKIKKIKCSRNNQIRIVTSVVNDIDYCDLSMNNAIIETARVSKEGSLDVFNSTINKLIVHGLNRSFPTLNTSRTKIQKILISEHMQLFAVYSDLLNPAESIYAEHIIIRAYRKYKMRRKLEILHELKKHLIKDLAAIVLQYYYV